MSNDNTGVGCSGCGLTLAPHDPDCPAKVISSNFVEDRIAEWRANSTPVPGWSKLLADAEDELRKLRAENKSLAKQFVDSHAIEGCLSEKISRLESVNAGLAAGHDSLARELAEVNKVAQHNGAVAVAYKRRIDHAMIQVRAMEDALRSKTPVSIHAAMNIRAALTGEGVDDK